MDDFIDQLKRHEGYRGEVYLDTEGVPTGGWGHAFLPGSRIPTEVAERLLRHDLQEVDPGLPGPRPAPGSPGHRARVRH